MTSELSTGPVESPADPDLVAVPAVAAAELDGLASAAAWQLLEAGSRQASRGTAVRAVTAVGPADQRRLVVLATLDSGALENLERSATFAVKGGGAATAVELELESLTRAGRLAMLVGRAVEAEGAAAAQTAPISIPTPDGTVRMAGVQGGDGEVALLVEVGQPAAAAEPIVYLHRGCVLGDALGARTCPRRRRLDAALARMREHGGGVVVYLRDEGSLGDCCVPAPASPRDASAGLRASLHRALSRLGLDSVELLATAADRRCVGGLGLRVARSTEPA